MGILKIGELERVLRPVPAPCVHVRHVHGQLQPAGAVLQSDLRELFRLDILHRAEGAKRSAAQHFQMSNDPHPDALTFERIDLKFKIDVTIARFRAAARFLELLARLRHALRQHRFPGQLEILGVVP